MKKKLIKILSIVLVLNIFLVPLSTFAPGNQIKTVQASGELVDIRFFNAMIAMIGITSAGVLYMSQSFSIPEMDMVALKDQFQTTLDGDATKKAAWMNAQTKYLSGGVAKTMGAAELAKIGINDIYVQFKTYLNEKIKSGTYQHLATNILTGYEYTGAYENIELYEKPTPAKVNLMMVVNALGSFNYKPYKVSPSIIQNYAYAPFTTYKDQYPVLTQGNIFSEYIFYNTDTNSWSNITYKLEYSYTMIFSNEYSSNNDFTNYEERAKIANLMGIDLSSSNFGYETINGDVNYTNTDNIINIDEQYIHVFPTIPFIDDSVPIGTVVTPAISAPYAGAVPIDVPISVPIDPTDPTDPTAPTYPDVLSATLAIIAALVPISGLLDNIKVGVGDIGDVIDTGLDSVIDGIGDIAGTLTGGITSSLTDIQSSLSTLTGPATETINLDPVKNIPKVLFTKFPFSIPWDLFNVYNLMATDNRTPPEFSLGIPITNSPTLSTFGVGDIDMVVKLENYDQVFGIIRVGELLLFVIGLIFATKKLIWG